MHQRHTAALYCSAKTKGTDTVSPRTQGSLDVCFFTFPTEHCCCNCCYQGDFMQLTLMCVRSKVKMLVSMYECYNYCLYTQQFQLHFDSPTCTESKKSICDTWSHLYLFSQQGIYENEGSSCSWNPRDFKSNHLTFFF